MPTQNSTLFPNYLGKRNAVSMVIFRFPFTISEIRVAEIFCFLGKPVYRNLQGFKKILLKYLSGLDRFFSYCLHVNDSQQFQRYRHFSIIPNKTNPPLAVYPDGVLAFSVSAQLLKTIPRWNFQIFPYQRCFFVLE
jgi:hypothetical protein